MQLNPAALGSICKFADPIVPTERGATLLNDILLPVETITRELDGKLLLAMFAAEAGFDVHIGAMNRIPEGDFGPSIYVAKSVRFAKQVKLMAQLGHKIAAWDEEGLVRFRDDIHMSRIEREAFSIPAALFSWGRSNSAIWRAHPFYNAVTIIESGNPRIDLLRLELRSLHREAAERLREQYGPFVLFNTNFSFVNHYKPQGRKPKIARGSYDSQSYLTFKELVDEHKRKIFRAFCDAIPEIAAAIAPRRLVIRPHPSENKAAWEQVAAGLANVSVVYEGGVAQWLLAASCLIHNGCTSAVEAAVMKRPVLAYRPVMDAGLDFFLPNALSENFTDVASMGARLREILDDESAAVEDAARAALIEEHVAALEGPFACERIVAALQQLRKADLDRASPLSRLIAHGKLAGRNLSHMVLRQDSRYERHKGDQDQFTAEEIAARAGQIGKVLGRFGGLSFERRMRGIVTVRNGAGAAS